ncbi:helix-turn-helix transcriptional regulator [Sporosarcina sp. FSL K6-1540]|uniref:helix-turn-helix domain-containing protein n=1 Tax=Sporosarcina sp. FSL K6-1540 TaxID=2921555 RepID=UPI00315A0013
MSILGNRIRNLRDSEDIQQVDFAKKIGVSNVVLSRYESGERKPDYETLIKIADYFDVTTDYLLGKTETPGAQNTVTVSGQEIKLSIEELKVFEELKKHPIMFHDLATDPETKVKELIKLYKMKKMFLEDDKEEYGDGFGELED